MTSADTRPVSSAACATPEIAAVTCEVPLAACATLRAISWVAAPCSSTAAAMAPEMPSSARMVPEIASIAVTVFVEAAWIASIWAPISSVALAVWAASPFTSEATTAKPLPASPARAASIVALSASRLVWLAIWLISFVTSPILPATATRLWTISPVRVASSTA